MHKIQARIKCVELRERVENTQHHLVRNHQKSSPRKSWKAIVAYCFRLLALVAHGCGGGGGRRRRRRTSITILVLSFSFYYFYDFYYHDS